MVGSLLDKTFYVTTGQQWSNHVGLTFMVAKIVDTGYVGVVTETGHGLGFTPDTSTTGFVQLLGISIYDISIGHLKMSQERARLLADLGYDPEPGTDTDPDSQPA